MMKKKEISDILYSTLKVYRTIVDHSSNWVYIYHYDCVLALRHTIKHYNKNNGFVPSSLKKNVFTVLAKDKIDFNATPSTATQYFHGHSMTTA